MASQRNDFNPAALARESHGCWSTIGVSSTYRYAQWRPIEVHSSIRGTIVRGTTKCAGLRF